MNKPLLLVITGRPGSGKTTLSERISREWCFPLLSRDRIKEGLVHTEGSSHEDLPENANARATQVFFGTIDYLISQGISVIAEAAFQHPLWEENLIALKEKARIVILVCHLDAGIALERFLDRGLSDENRIRFHGDKGVRMKMNGITPQPGDYIEPHLDMQTIYLDTTDGYDPDIETLKEIILPEQSKPRQPVH